VPEQRCEEESKLAHALVAAITRVYIAKRDLDEAREKKLDTASYLSVLQDARTAERHAVRALDEHKTEHKCANITGRSPAL
jgi:hypothetical protein